MVYHVGIWFTKIHKPLDLNPIFITKISGKCLRNNEGVIEGATGAAIVLHGGVK